MENNRRHSSGSEYIPPDDSNEVWECTSKWREYQMEVLKINLVDGKRSDFIIGEPSINDGLIENVLLSSVVINDRNPPTYLTKAQKIFYRRVVQVTESKDEPPVDLVISELLEASDFESNELHFRPRPHLEMEWKGKCISSEPDFGVYSDESRESEILEYMMVVEAKRAKATSLQPERQLCGEMLVASYGRFLLAMGDQEVFGMIVHGNLIRFYKATFSKEYLIQISEDKIPNESVKVTRYPPRNCKPLSLINPVNREEIIMILPSIRERIIKQL